MGPGWLNENNENGELFNELYIRFRADWDYSFGESTL